MNRYGIIYKVVNKLNGKVYIGQTRRELKVRWKEHWTNSTKYGILYRAVKKYTKKNFIVEELCTCFNEEELNKQEKYFVDLYNSIVPNGYNLTDGGNNFAISEKTRQKMSISHIGMLRPNLWKQIKDQDGKIYRSIKDAAKQLNCNVSSIKDVLKGRCYWCKGFHFEYVNGESQVYKHRPLKKKIKDINGIIYNSLDEANKKTGIANSTIRKILRGQKSDYGKFFSFVEV